MTNYAPQELENFMSGLRKRNPGELEFHQAVEEVAMSLMPFIIDNPKYMQAQLLERLTEPDRVIIFRVCWQDDQGNIRTNRGYRVQFSNCIGPYKGGLRFHPSVSLSILKFLGFEQIFKNSLTTLPLGGGKGGANFNPKGKSDGEVMRFCQSFMTELSRHIGADIDIPAGDIGVGAREIGFLYGQFKRLNNRHTGAITGKGFNYGGSRMRPEATGYGCVYMMREVLSHAGDDLDRKTCLVSGSGNVAQFCAEKLIQLGAKVLTMSDSSGTIYDPEGINEDKLAWIKDLKNIRRGRIAEYAKQYPLAQFLEGKRPWSIPADLAFPCATQNEIEAPDAKALIANSCHAICEGANMPSTKEAIDLLQAAKIIFVPGKAANAGGVAVSGLEMTQNSMRIHWSAEEVDQRLLGIMQNIHQKCVQYGTEDDYIDYVKGANIAAFSKIADTMLAYGVV
ncbi:NADP-specific glutamate dehydrogenase [Lentisphaera profundi]|uniref:Glutamate dehydrogenase n=1 Tax=Lentisphaera profundi TaxID=1658616 RepID=A0ABY7VX17_9BACT|nr:NADP-specific glutamate dehydrogenase [Lentisphaera profundi]WDE98745.1 NADP-specific glutamate dehydrogenase [Lentisphaera profundi]